MNNIKVLILIILNVELILCTKLFFRGRPLTRHGMLGNPVGKKFLKRNLNIALPMEQWFEQKLDHFNPASNITWKQRYFVNDTFYKAGGPIFLQLGGEGTADPIWVVMGQVATRFALNYNALVVELEHRYYGKSHPTSDMSVKNLVYLTSEQALADAANFISAIKEPNQRLIVFGGSYSGSLAAWLRLKYPHLVNGAIASSAPVQAVIDFKEYVAVVRDSLGSACDSAISEATTELSKLLEHRVGWKTIEKNFKLCDELDGTNQDDVYNLMENFAGNFENVVQYNKDNRDFEGAPGGNITIDVICGIMTDNSRGSAIDRYSAVNELILNTYGQKCVDFSYRKFVKQMQQTSWDTSAGEGGRQWTYQTCVEFGFFQSSTLDSQPFGKYFPVEFFEKQCVDIFGPKFNLDLLKQAVQFTNNNYGGFKINVRKVAFPNGSIDPWHALGITSDISEEAIAIFINGTAHCADMYPDSSDDSLQLKLARNTINDAIGDFLEQD